ncbi:MAG: DUF5615 family PIN-like protein [Candidatus Schekmanbacteria bacterium]|nr:DUF5615 family PIN-like protein [Candidatus Schekmanbacteria bacterium]
MKILIDVNLTPDWVNVFKQQGLDAIHWSSVGDLRASDRIIMEWARNNGYVVFTHDLDFGVLLAATNAEGPSVVQVRTQDVLPRNSGIETVKILKQYESVLEMGALISIDKHKSRIRILPLRT